MAAPSLETSKRGWTGLGAGRDGKSPPGMFFSPQHKDVPSKLLPAGVLILLI